MSDCHNDRCWCHSVPKRDEKVSPLIRDLRRMDDDITMLKNKVGQLTCALEFVIDQNAKAMQALEDHIDEIEGYLCR